MYSDNFTKIRRFLLDSGFVSDQAQAVESGKIYYYNIPELKTAFQVDLSAPCVNAQYPDFAFNKRNPYSGKDTIVTFSWNIDEEQELTIENMKNFFDKIIGIAKRG